MNIVGLLRPGRDIDDNNETRYGTGTVRVRRFYTC